IITSTKSISTEISRNYDAITSHRIWRVSHSTSLSPPLSKTRAIKTMKRYKTIALALSTAVAAGCKDNPVANPIDAPTVDALSGALTPTSLRQLVVGALAQDRATWNGVASAIEAGIFARDVYRIDASEPRYVP